MPNVFDDIPTEENIFDKIPGDEAPPPRNAIQNLTHMTDLTTRGVIGGLAGAAAMPADLGVYAANTASELVGHPLNLKMPSQDFDEKLTKLTGMSQAENAPERYYQTGISAITGGALGPEGSMLPMLQGAGAAQTAGELGLPYGGQLAAGIVGGGMAFPKGKPTFVPLAGTLDAEEATSGVVDPSSLKAKSTAADYVLRALKADGVRPADIGDRLAENLPSGKPFVGMDFAHDEENDVMTKGSNTAMLGMLAPRMSVLGKKIAGATAARTVRGVQADRVNSLLDSVFTKRGYYDIKDDVLGDIAKNTPGAYEKAFQGGSTAPLEEQMQAHWNNASEAEQSAKQEAAKYNRQLIQLAGRKTYIGNNVYALNSLLTDERALQAQLDAATQKAQAAATKKDSYLALMKKAQEDKSANAPGAVWTPQIQEFLDRPEMKSGIALGLKIASRDAVGTGSKYNPYEYAHTGEYDAEGNPVIASVPTMRLLDAGKKGLDTQIQAEYDPATRKYSENGRSLIDFKNRLVGHMDEINPDYAAARKTFADPMGVETALNMGRDYKSYDPEEIQQMFSGDPTATRKYGVRVFGTQAEKQAYMVGVKRSIQDAMVNSKDATTAINKSIGSEKLRPMFPSDHAYDDFVSQVNDANRMKNSDILSQSNQSMTGPFRNLEDSLQDSAIKPYMRIIRSGLGFKRMAKAAAGTAIDNHLQADMYKASDLSAGEITRLLHSSDPQTFYDLQALADKQGTKFDGVSGQSGGIFSKIKNFAQRGALGGALGASITTQGGPPLTQAMGSIPFTPSPPVASPGAPAGASGGSGTPPPAPGPVMGPPAPPVVVPPAFKDLPPDHAEAATDLGKRIIKAESGNNPNAQSKTSSAGGLAQFTVGEWRALVYKFGKETGLTLNDRMKPEAQEKMLPYSMKDNAKILAKNLGTPPSDGDIYAAHVLGAHKATTLIRAAQSPDDPVATTIMPHQVVQANRSIFFDHGVPRTASEVYAFLDKKVSPSE